MQRRVQAKAIRKLKTSEVSTVDGSQWSIFESIATPKIKAFSKKRIGSFEVELFMHSCTTAWTFWYQPMICCSSTVSRPQDWCQACLIQPCCKPCTKTSGIQVFHAISAQSLCPQVGHILFGTYFSTYNETFVGPGLNSENMQANASGSPNSTSMEEGMSSSIAQVSSPTTNLMQWKRSTASLLVWSIAPVLLNALPSQIKKAILKQALFPVLLIDLFQDAISASFPATQVL